MRICYDNALSRSADLAMTNLANDSSADSLYHEYLELTASCTQPSTVLTGSLSEGEHFNALAVAFHNAQNCVYTLYDESGAVLATGDIALDSFDSIYYPFDVQGVRSFSLAFTGGSTLFIGHVFLGEYLELPRFDVGGSFDLDLQSVANTTKGGQRYGVRYRQLSGFSVSWTRINNDARQAIREYAAEVQTVVPHMVDFFPGAHAEEPPVYASLADSPKFTKRPEADFYYKAELKYQEAR